MHSFQLYVEQIFVKDQIKKTMIVGLTLSNDNLLSLPIQTPEETFHDSSLLPNGFIEP